MIYAIIFLTLYCIYLHITKASDKQIPYELYDRLIQVETLYKEHMKPLAEEYRILKGQAFMTLRADYVEYSDETIAYGKLPEKLEQLKKDMKRGCEIFCKEENGT